MSIRQILGLQKPTNPLDNTNSQHDPDPTVLKWINEIIPSGKQLLDYFISLFPFLRWIRYYNMQWLLGDLVAGATVGAVVIPQSMGYARLAGLPVQYGLYTSFMGGVVYWLFATSKDVTIGPVAVMSTLLGSIVADMQAYYPSISGPQIAMSITVICGGIVTFMGLARLGFIVDFIPLPSITAFVTGSAITICSGQVKSLLGETADFSTRAPAYRIIINSLKNLPSSSKYDSAMGVSALVTLYMIRAACNYTARKYPRREKSFCFLSALRTVFVIFIFTMISAIVNCHRREDPAFAIVGYVPRGFQDAAIPQVRGSIVKEISQRLPACVVVLILEHIAIAKAFGRINNYTINPSQELIAIGVTNLLGPFIGAYSATGAFSRSAIQAKSGARTPIAGIITAIVVLIAIYTLTTALYYIPHASLSGVIIHAVGDLIVAPNTIYQFWRISPLDAVIFAVGLVVAITSTIENSIYITVFLALVILLFRCAKSPGQFLATARVGDKDHQHLMFLQSDDPSNSHPDLKLEMPLAGVFIYRFSEGFNYPNASHYTDALVRRILENTRSTNSEFYGKKGDRPWNDPHHHPDRAEMELPLLRAIILDFSAVNNVDITSIQNLVDVRNQLNHRAAPLGVQWHLVSVRNRWTRRALAAAGFGYPTSPSTISEIGGKLADSSISPGHGRKVDFEKGEEIFACQGCEDLAEPYEKKLRNIASGPLGNEIAHRPFFHNDLPRALERVEALLRLDASTGNI
ncbi:sulfate anion transporter [Penicillium argentinense]|uniref:Sulfate anion transporter n=1 Tax=Penicillium argentinense TaxID=1131581 RepID=A0A9W9ENW2_9EURO|nr:sulfate anion transporter [Penicillium argentinense]KAJ5085174.1 sulfate anion transporter [Penicillium argentinense]